MRQGIPVLPGIILLLWTLLLVALFTWSALSERKHVHDLALRQARAFFQQIVSTREWNAEHGGVYVLVGAGVEPNPYLTGPERDLVMSNGTMLTQINPAYMTRQISEILSTAAGVSFHITSLAPLRPENAPDTWEARALSSFQNTALQLPLAAADAGPFSHSAIFSDSESTPRTVGPLHAEAFELVRVPAGLENTPASAQDGTKDVPPIEPPEQHMEIFRYMAPLVAVPSCLPCHQELQGRSGGIRGGISVSVAAAPLLQIGQENINRMGMGYTLIGIVGLLGIGTATFQIMRKREQAEAANTMKSMFLANMSHDMRTPLTGIVGMAELLRHNATDSRQKEYAEQLQVSAETLLDIVTDITDFSRLESGGLTLLSAPFSLSRLLDEAQKVVRFSCDRKGIALHAHIAPDVPDCLEGDSFRLRQMVGNLLGNAVKFTKCGSISVQVALRERDARSCMLVFSVHDTGMGISTDQHATIFDSFTQGDEARAHGHVGTGLGLSITRQLVEMMGGTIRVESMPGKGSVFTFTARFRLPLTLFRSVEMPGVPAANHGVPECAAGAPSSPSLSADEQARRSRPRILVADDNALNRAYLQEVLSLLGYAMYPACNGVEALATLRTPPEGIAFAAVLMDGHMPGLDGLETTRRIRSGKEEGIAPDIPIAAITAFTAPGDRERFLQSGMNAYICKPMKPDAIAAVLEQLVGITGKTSPILPQYADPREPFGKNEEDSLSDADTAEHPNSSAEVSEFDSGETPPVFPGTGPSPDVMPPSAPWLDEPAALRAMAGNHTLLLRLCAAFLEEVPDRCQELAQALHSGQLADVVRLSHAVKNSAGLIAAIPLRDAAALLEKAVLRQDDAKAKRELQVLLYVLSSTQAHIQTLLGRTE